MKALTLNPIGRIRVREGRYFLALDARYAEGLLALEGFGHLCVLWWFDGCDDERSRSTLSEEVPYVNAPERIGTFATRSPQRPNPIALSIVGVMAIDPGRAEIEVDYIDAEDGSPLLDIKPYTPSLDRVEHPRVPDWCASWPASVEASGDFDWSRVFNF